MGVDGRPIPLPRQHHEHHHHSTDGSRSSKSGPEVHPDRRRQSPVVGVFGRWGPVSAETVAAVGVANARATPPRPWLTDDEAAEYIRKTPRWMRRAAERHTISCSYAGRSRVWNVDDLDGY